MAKKKKKADFNWITRGEFGLLPWYQQYVYNLGVMGSQNISTLLGGDPGETLSSRTGKAVVDGNWFAIHILAPFLGFLFLDPAHALKSIQEDEGKKEIWHWGTPRG